MQWTSSAQLSVQVCRHLMGMEVRRIKVLKRTNRSETAPPTVVTENIQYKCQAFQIPSRPFDETRCEINVEIVNAACADRQFVTRSTFTIASHESRATWVLRVKSYLRVGLGNDVLCTHI